METNDVLVKLSTGLDGKRSLPQHAVKYVSYLLVSSEPSLIDAF